MSPASNSTRNRPLLALPSRHLARLAPDLEPIRYQREQVLIEAEMARRRMQLVTDAEEASVTTPSGWRTRVV